MRFDTIRYDTVLYYTIPRDRPFRADPSNGIRPLAGRYIVVSIVVAMAHKQSHIRARRLQSLSSPNGCEREDSGSSRQLVSGCIRPAALRLSSPFRLIASGSNGDDNDAAPRSLRLSIALCVCVCLRAKFKSNAGRKRKCEQRRWRRRAHNNCSETIRFV